MYGNYRRHLMHGVYRHARRSSVTDDVRKLSYLLPPPRAQPPPPSTKKVSNTFKLMGSSTCLRSVPCPRSLGNAHSAGFTSRHFSTRTRATSCPSRWGTPVWLSERYAKREKEIGQEKKIRERWSNVDTDICDVENIIPGADRRNRREERLRLRCFVELIKARRYSLTVLVFFFMRCRHRRRRR